MPPVLRHALILGVRYELLTTGVALKAPLRPHDGNALSSRRNGGKPLLSKTFRRTLFELHSGRQVRELPSELLLEEISPTQETISDRQFGTSEDLIAALGPIGLEYRVDPRILRGKLDHSYLENPALLDLNRSEAYKHAWKVEKEVKILGKKGADQVNLRSLLIQYLRHVDPILKYQARLKSTKLVVEELNGALLDLLTEDNTRYLSFRGMDIRDLMTWTWILTSETTERAATRLLAVAHQNFTNTTGRWTIPVFVYVFLLRRRNVSAGALRSLLIYAWELLENSEKLLGPFQRKKFAYEPLQDESRKRIIKMGITETVFVIAIIRLLRTARRVWPAACNSIVALTSRYLDGLNFHMDFTPTTNLALEDTARLTYIYNKLLKLVSLPASIGPYRSAFHQQRAQFILLRRMNAFEPPLVVDRKGYRAVISMQLMHKKTLKEREWAQMKAKSWPPWKEEKLGIDADIGVEHGTSRAMEAMRRSWEAGYAPDDWDAVASVLSGWDTDRSPTIQTRAVHRPNDPGFADAKVWVSRIRATRTLDEAWSCFLSYKDQKTTVVGAHHVYHQMFAKIVQDAKRPRSESPKSISTNYTDEQQPLPGDGVEVLAAPESPREAVYVRIPSPNIDEFVEMMANDKIRPPERFLSSMLINAPTIKTGLQYIQSSAIPKAHIRVLIDRKPPSSPEDQTALESIPYYLFASFIRLLTQFSRRCPNESDPKTPAFAQTGSTVDSVMENTKSAQLYSPKTPPDSEQSLQLASSPRSIARNPLFEAIQLVLARRPRYRPVWYHLLRALSQRRVVTDLVSKFVDQDYQDIKTWQMTCRLLNEMFDIDLTLDLDGFHILCTGLEKAIFAGERLSRSSHNQQGSRDPNLDTGSDVDHILSAGLPLLKQIFKDVVRSNSMQQDMPTTLMEESSKIKGSIEERGEAESDDLEEDSEGKSSLENGAFLPPACLLPKLLEVPHPACLHAFVRVLGLRRDYDGLLDLVEWMSLFADEINAVADESANGYRMMRRCLTAIHVFMERSWIARERREAEAQGEDPSTVRDELEMKAEPAPMGIVKAVQEVVKENVRWGCWPEPDEVEEYCAKGNFI